MRLKLPYPPSINHYWRRAGFKIHTSSQGKTYQKAVKAILEAMEIKPTSDRLSVRIECCPPDRRRRDLDNIQKPLLDSLKHGGVYDDDCQIDRLLTVRGPVTEGGLVKVTIRSIKPRTLPAKKNYAIRKVCKILSSLRDKNSSRCSSGRTKSKRKRRSTRTCGPAKTIRASSCQRERAKRR